MYVFVLFVCPADEFVDAMEKKWHVNHFVCMRCNCPIDGGDFKTYEGKPYCIEDYNSLFVKKVRVLCSHTFRIQPIARVSLSYHNISPRNFSDPNI